MRIGPLGKSCATRLVAATPSRPVANSPFINLDATCAPPTAGLWSWTCRLLVAHLAPRARGPYCENLIHLCRFRICLVVVKPLSLGKPDIALLPRLAERGSRIRSVREGTLGERVP